MGRINVQNGRKEMPVKKLSGLRRRWILQTVGIVCALGLLCGSILGVKQVGGICGALLTNLSAWLSGVWFDLKLVGGAFEKIANVLPFVHAAELEKALFAGAFRTAAEHMMPVLLYSILATVGAVLCFLRQMKTQ